MTAISNVPEKPRQKRVRKGTVVPQSDIHRCIQFPVTIFADALQFGSKVQ